MELEPPPHPSLPSASEPLPGPRRPLPGPTPETLRAGGHGLVIAGAVLVPVAVALFVFEGPLGFFRHVRVRQGAAVLFLLAVAALIKGLVMYRRARRAEASVPGTRPSGRRRE